MGVVKELVEEAFSAGLKREEGNLLKFGLALTTEADIAHETGNKFVSPCKFLRLASPETLCSEAIRKIAPASDPQYSILAVMLNESNSTLEIVGIWTFRPKKNRFNEIPVGIPIGTSFLPDLFTVYSNSPGSVAIARGDTLIGRIIDRDFIRATPTPFTSKSLGSVLYDRAQSHQLFAEFPKEYWVAYRDLLELLLQEIANSAQGASLILLPENFSAFESDLLKIRLRYLQTISFKPLLKGMLEAGTEMLLRIAYGQLICERVALVSRLARIDGVLLLSESLDLIGYGAKLQAPPWDEQIYLGPDGFGIVPEPNEFATGRLGTRHTSSINFAGAVSGSICFVVSEDGPIRAFTRSDDNRLLCWPDISETVFVQ